VAGLVPAAMVCTAALAVCQSSWAPRLSHCPSLLPLELLACLAVRMVLLSRGWWGGSVCGNVPLYLYLYCMCALSWSQRHSMYVSHVWLSVLLDAV